MTKNPFHKWLIRQRHYCELCTGPYPATEVIEYKGKNRVVCDAHARANQPIEAGLRERGRLEAR